MSDKTPQQILAIDDDANILEIIKLALEGEGYQVHTASKPKEGLDLYQKLGAAVDLVLLDYIMPGMNGDAVFQGLRQLNPNVRVLLLTACDDRVAKDMFAQGLRGYVQKPFYLNQLLEQVQESLGG
jgi:CheY-like chemotaxis protein